MKYIRTKEGIYDKIDETLRLATCPPKYELKKNGEHISYIHCKDCQLADTIEELCDEFVIKGTNWQQIIDLESARYNLKRPTKLKVYGAIWTEKGLIYVAKMNDKGEFELL